MKYIHKINQSVHIGTQATRLSVYWRDGLAIRLLVCDNLVVDLWF